MTKQHFSMEKINYEVVRKQARRKMLLLSIVPASIIFMIALWFLAPTLLTNKAIDIYTSDKFNRARAWLTPLTWSSPEQFVIAFNSGTVDTQLGRYDIAEKELTHALSLAPPPKRCMVAQNLVSSIEAHGESLKSQPAEVKVYASKAAVVKKANPTCFKKPPPPPPPGGGGGGGSSSSSTAADSQTPDDAQQKQLQQKEQKGQERQEQFARDETFNADDPKIKPW